MEFESFFPLDKERYAFVIRFFSEYTTPRAFPQAFSRWARGEICSVGDYAGISIPSPEDNELHRGPTIWEGPDSCAGEFEPDFHEFAVTMLSAAKFFLAKAREQGITEYVKVFNCVTNAEEVFTQARFIADVETFRKNFCNVGWIKEHCYGEGQVVDSEGVLTGEYHGAEWGELWYEKFGRLLKFDDIETVDDVIRAGNAPNTRSRRKLFEF